MPSVRQFAKCNGVSTFTVVEAYDRQRHAQEGVFPSGATNTLTHRVGQEWWVTAVGEVPAQTLKAFAVSLERRR